MYAVVRTGGKQYKVAANDVIKVEKLAGAAGDTVAFDDVLLIAGDDGVNMGKPALDGARVTATVLDQAKADKIVVFKRKRRKGYRKTLGHRQEQTVLRITGIETGA